MFKTKALKIGGHMALVLTLVVAVIIALAGCGHRPQARAPALAAGAPAAEQGAPAAEQPFRSRWTTEPPVSRYRASAEQPEQGVISTEPQARAVVGTMPDGRDVGTIEFRQLGDALLLDAHLNDMPLGTHVVSIANSAACPLPGFDGDDNDITRREGAALNRTDVGSVRIDVGGSTEREWTTRQAMLEGPKGIVGRSVIIVATGTPVADDAAASGQASAHGALAGGGANARTTPAKGQVLACGVIHPVLR